MYELIQLSENDYCIDSPTRIGLVRVSDRDVVLIDSGSDKDAGKKVLRHLETNGWTLKAILNTHSHADHVGGNRFLQDRTGCAIYASGIECAYTLSPILEPTGLYGGRPFKDLRHKFLMAQESYVQPLISEAATDLLSSAGLKILPLPGHSYDQVGFLTKEGTAFIADSVSSEATLQKYSICYLWDAETSIRTLEQLMELTSAAGSSISSLSIQRFVPAHAPICDDIAPLAAINKNAIEKVQAAILELCETPLTFEVLLKKLFDRFCMTMSAQQYALIGSTVRSYLTGLYESGRIAFFFEENEMEWKTEE